MRLEKEEISFIFATEDLVPDPAPFDHSRAAAFEERLVGALNSGALCLMTSVGHRVGLFDAMADLPAAGSEAIAAHSGLNERYVREWLGRWSPAGLWITSRGTAPTPLRENTPPFSLRPPPPPTWRRFCSTILC